MTAGGTGGSARALDSRAQREPASVWLSRTRPIGRSGLAGDRYSRRVALLKRILPVIGLTLLALVGVWPRLGPLLESVRLGFPVIDLREARELRMLNPRYAGIDRFDRPYVVTSAVGRQVPNRDDLMSLEQPRAEMTLRRGASVVVTAATAMYQSQAQLLDLFDAVNLVHENGTRFVTRSAHVDVSANTAEGHDPVVGHGPSGDITAEGFRILEKGDTIIFTGDSHLLLKGTRPTASIATPPALPPEVAAAVSQIEAATATPAAVAPETATLINLDTKSPPADAAAKPDGAAKPHTAGKRDAKAPAGRVVTGDKARRDAS
jgi:lipopolysaccharide export system protein LptC